MLANNGDGTFASRVNYSTNHGSAYVAAADFNGDGKLDLVAADNWYGGVNVLMNQTNFPAKAAVATLSGGQSQNVRINYSLSNLEGEACRVQVEYSTDGGGTWKTATAGAGGDGTTNLASSASGTAHTFVWASATDLAHASSSNVQIRIPPADANVGLAGTSGAFTVDNTTQVVGRWVFYNTSYFDGNDPSANSADDNAIATDKVALLPGQTATFANYTSYSRGINGIMVDVHGSMGTPTASDFIFQVSDNSASPTWTAGPAPVSVTVRPLANGDRRVSLIWADNAIQEQWLQVTMLADANTGLASNDVFYFGNAIAESGNVAGNATFKILGRKLRTTSVFGHTGKQVYKIRVRVTDKNGLWYEKAMKIGVTQA